MISGNESGTGFLVKLTHVEPNLIAFMTAGHIFENSTFDFDNFHLSFGNTSGDENSNCGLKNCTLASLSPFQGSIGLNGKRYYFPCKKIEKSRKDEDYCLFILSNLDDRRLDPLITEVLTRHLLEREPIKVFVH